ncbi:kinase-like domain-containing protein [Mycena metata]|uniref:Kinase-like domain-containing protein n=1 Tax=Mycena metata TaxID=1033252 RepID=A0AAD7N497_9AGAR|nr:kinase-like domain-containing protein [Mycena metata]
MAPVTDPKRWARMRENSGIQEREMWWVEHQPFLLSRGYALRPRYNPNWTPTWELPGNEELSTLRCEDSLPIKIAGNVLDAIRIADNVKVVLKLVSSQEMNLSWYLGDYRPEMEPDSSNRSVPLLESIDFEISKIEHPKYKGILVFPFLRQFDDPPFRRRSEVTEALEQFLRGMEYMHAKNVAHRDLCYRNLMVDARRMIPLGWHFIAPWSHYGTKVGIKSETRSSVGPVNYYIIDFGLSTEFYDILPEDAQDVGKYGQDKTVPELSETVAYNPFKVDVYQLGNVIAKLVDVGHPTDTFLQLIDYLDLAELMTSRNPHQRPTASECVKFFRNLVLTMVDDPPVYHLSESSSDSESDNGSLDSISNEKAPQSASEHGEGVYTLFDGPQISQHVYTRHRFGRARLKFTGERVIGVNLSYFVESYAAKKIGSRRRKTRLGVCRVYCSMNHI